MVLEMKQQDSSLGEALADICQTCLACSLQEFASAGKPLELARAEAGCRLPSQMLKQAVGKKSQFVWDFSLALWVLDYQV